MKKTFTFLFLLSFIAASFAQPVINNTFTPVIGSSYTLFTCDTTGITPGPSGAGVTWDFSTLSQTSTTTMTVKNPSATPYTSDYTNATLAIETGGSSYTYWNGTLSNIMSYGAAAASIKSVYSNPLRYIAFPMNYNDFQSDAYSGTTYYTGGSMTRSGNGEMTYDGYGTLITPFDTYTDVVRIKFVDSYTVSGMTGTHVGTTYSFYHVSSMIPIVTVMYIDIAGGTAGDDKIVQYTDFTVGIEEDLLKQHLSVYPNPAMDVLSISNDFAFKGNWNVTVMDVNGRMIMDETYSEVQRDVNLDVAALPSGLYLVNVDVAGTSASYKITVQ